MSSSSPQRSSPSSSPSSFGCEAQNTFSFPLHCKRSFNPTLTHQFEVEWPWPVVRAASFTQQAGLLVATTAGSSGDSALSKEQEGPDGPADLNEITFDHDNTDQDSAKHTWRDRRCYGHPTFILDLSSDPFKGTLDTRRAGLLLSPGYRLLLPLTILDPPEELPDAVGHAFWKPTYKAPPGAASHTVPPPYCAELVVGELVALEKTVRQRREAAGATMAECAAGAYQKSSFSVVTLSPSKIADASAASSEKATSEREVEVKRKYLVPTLPSSAAVPTQTSLMAMCVRTPPKILQNFFFYTIPFRIRWLSQLEGCIVVSLPCEERLVTLSAPHRLAASLTAIRTTATTTVEPMPMTLVHSFALPRGVVPLDVAEILDRPFLAVGTHDHGVLLCSLNITTGAVENIARCISLRGHGGVLFPVTRLVTIFPSLQPKKIPKQRNAAVAPAWVRRAAELESLRDGALLCSSPYEPTTTLVKLDGAAGGTMEDFSTMRAVDTVLDVSPTLHPDVGPVVCTASRKVMWLRCSTPGEVVEILNAARGRRVDFSVAERTLPAVMCERMARLDYPLLRLMASPPVLQSFTSNYVSRHNYTKHWRFGVDNRNRIILMDRTVTQYVFQSAFQLYRCRRTGGEQVATVPPGSVLASDTMTVKQGDGVADTLETGKEEGVGKATAVKQEEADADEEENVGGSPVATLAIIGTKRGRLKTKTTKASTHRTVKQPTTEAAGEDGAGSAAGSGVIGATQAFIASVPQEDACSGVVVVFARDEIIQVAAAHDRHYVSLVTWRIGSPQPTPPADSFFSPAMNEER